MNILLDYLLPFIVALGALIFFHELGHYAVARWNGVKVLRFSVGFGKPLLRWHVGRDRTEWVLAAIPLGGYVKMLDEREAPVAQEELSRSFNRQPVGRRFAIVAAGPLANFLLAILLYWGVFVGGMEELQPRLAQPESATAAAMAGISDGDLVLQIDATPVRSWGELSWALLQEAVDHRTVEVRVRTAQGTETIRYLNLSGVRLEGEKPNMFDQLGLKLWRPQVPPRVGEVRAGSPAAQVGIQPGDEIVMVEGRPIRYAEELIASLSERADLATQLVVLRQGVELQMQLTPEGADNNGKRVGRIGIMVANAADTRAQMFTTVHYGVADGFVKAIEKTWQTSVFTLRMIGRMMTGHLSLDNLSGPISIADYAGQSAQLGLSYFVSFVAVISISIGVLNLLPIPVLDGGHLLYYTIEMIKGRPVSDQAMEFGQRIGLLLLAMLMAFAFYNDLTRVFSG